MQLPDTPCLLNGRLLPLSQATVSVLDRGFIFGDGIYEVVPVYGGRMFRFEQHMARLERSLAEVRIANPHSRAQWLSLLNGLLAHADTPVSPKHLIYLQITRGVAPRDHVMPSDITPTVFAMVNPMSGPSQAQRDHGVQCVSAEDFRWRKAHIKSTSLLGSVMSRQISADVQAIETVMFRDGLLSEAASSNVWIVKDGAVSGPLLDGLVLEGIRYGLLQELCESAGIAFSLRPIARDEVFAADEVLLSSATKEVLAVVQIDDHLIGDGRPGPIGQELARLYQIATAHTVQPTGLPIDTVRSAA